MFKGQRCNPKKGVEAHRGVAGKVGVSERRRQVATETIVEVWLCHTPGVAVLAKAGMIWHGRQGSLSVFISQGRQVEPSSRRATPISSTPLFLSSLTILLAKSYANGENTRLAFLSRTREDIMHRYWLSANPYQVFIRYPIRRSFAGPKSRLPLFPREPSPTYVLLVRHSL